MNPLRTGLSAMVLAVCVASIPGAESASAQGSAKTEAYLVYSALLANMSGSGQRFVVIRGETLAHRINPDMLKNERLKEDLAPLEQETVDNYNANNRQAVKLSRDLDVNLHYVLLRKDEEKAIFRNQLTGWHLFRQIYPGASGIVTFSAVGFNSAMDQALVYRSTDCGSLCGGGGLGRVNTNGGPRRSERS